MKTKVSIEGAEFFAHHGYFEEERKKGNYFIIDAFVELKSFDSLDDNINDTINYQDLYNICSEEMQNTQKLLETVTFNILNKVKTQLENVTSAKIKLRKLSPNLGGKVDSSSVEMSF